MSTSSPRPALPTPEAALGLSLRWARATSSRELRAIAQTSIEALTGYRVRVRVDASALALGAPKAPREAENGPSVDEPASAEPQLQPDGAWPLRVPVTHQGRELGVIALAAPADAVGQEGIDAFWTQGAGRAMLGDLAAMLALSLDRLVLVEGLSHIKREWRAMLDGIVDGVYACDDGGVISRANRAFAGMIGVPVTHVLGRSRDQLWRQQTGFAELSPWRSSDEGGEFKARTRELRCSEPERVFTETAFELCAEPSAREALPEADSEQGLAPGGWLCVVRDVTESRRLQEQLIQSEKLAALGELTSGVAHELNNPLATVAGYAELLGSERAGSDLSEVTRKRLQTIHQEAMRASNIVSNLLAYARRSSGERAFVELNEVVKSVLEMRAYGLATDDVRVVTDLSPATPPIWGETLQLQQVVLNIVNNAAQAVQGWRGSGGEIRIATRPISLHGRPGAQLWIEDNGPGIAPDHLRRVFDPFFTTKQTGEGTGLGMSIAARIISNHDGLIRAESVLGHGARFLIELPAAGDAQPSTDAAPTPSFQAPTVPGARVLVVDDEEPVIMLISELLGLDGHTVTPAFNGGEALALLKADDFDLIVSDVRMPAVGGPTFFEILQTTRPDLLPRVLFVTGDTMSRSTQEFLRGSGRPTLAKPFDPEALRALVARLLSE